VSWDLYLVPPEQSENVGEWLEEVAEERHDEAAARSHADAIRRRRPELELGGPYVADYQLTMPEDSGLPIDVGLYGNHASISVAYWDLGPRTAELGDIIVDIVEALGGTTGWVPYDPQEDRIIREEELRDLFGSGHAHGVALTDEIVRSADQPKRKRRFKLF
jgi:hypothetical protein